jgi:hypothetical protein
MFYLYVSDPLGNQITIGTLQDFYQAESEAEDWTDKIDDNKEITIQANAFVEGSNYVFQYNEEKDYFNTEYAACWPCICPIEDYVYFGYVVVLPDDACLLLPN